MFRNHARIAAPISGAGSAGRLMSLLRPLPRLFGLHGCHAGNQFRKAREDRSSQEDTVPKTVVQGGPAKRSQKELARGGRGEEGPATAGQGDPYGKDRERKRQW